MGILNCGPPAIFKTGLQYANEPEACHKQERAYRADKAYMATVNEGRAVGINAELLVRRNLWPYNLLGNAWMRAYLQTSPRSRTPSSRA